MDRRQTSSFVIKKWTLFSFCLVGIVGSIIMAAIASSVIDSYIDSHYHVDGFVYTKQTIDSLKSATKTIVYVAAVFAILFHLLGLCGAYKEHYCMTMTYAILMTLGALGSFVSAVRIPTYWFASVLDILICVVAYSFLHDLRQIRLQLFTTPFYVSNPGPSHTVNIMNIPGPSSGSYGGQQQYGQNYGPPQPYGQQQYGSQSTGQWQSPPPPPYTPDKGVLP